MSMQNKDIHENDDPECRAVEVLTSRNSGNTIGYCLGGGRPGPNLLVSGYEPLIGELFDKLIEVPTLPWMWGKLYLVNLNALDEEYLGNPVASLENVVFDETIALQPLDGSMDVVESTTESYLKVLRTAAGMGMIAGRGISSER